MKKLLIVFILGVFAQVNAQISVNAGASVLLGTVRDAGAWGGFHLGAELPTDDQTAYYLRFTHHFKNRLFIADEAFLTPIDPNDFDYPFIGRTTSMTYNLVEGGIRYYLGSGFDFGWAVYGGTNFMIIISTVKDLGFEEFDEDVYVLDENFTSSLSDEGGDGSIYSLGAGLGGGVKYTQPRLGTFYFDMNLNYLLLTQTTTPQPTGFLFSQLIFNFNLGYRYDINW